MSHSLQERDGWERIRLRIPRRYDTEQHDCWLFRMWTKEKRLQWIKENIASLLTGSVAYTLCFTHSLISLHHILCESISAHASLHCEFAVHLKIDVLHLLSWIYVTSVFLFLFFLFFWKQRVFISMTCQSLTYFCSHVRPPHYTELMFKMCASLMSTHSSTHTLLLPWLCYIIKANNKWYILSKIRHTLPLLLATSDNVYFYWIYCDQSNTFHLYDTNRFIDSLQLQPRWRFIVFIIKSKLQRCCMLMTFTHHECKKLTEFDSNPLWQILSR